MTDKEKLVELLDSHCDYAGHVDCKDDCTKCLADHLLANGMTVQGWISVEERLPENDGSYLVYTARGSVCVVHFYTQKIIHETYVRPEGWSGKGKVTHWMPLPQLPKEGVTNG